MDLETICKEFSELDAEVKQEFYSDVKDCVQDINDCAPILTSEDPQVLINRLFRSIHTIKGNCNMVFLEPYVQCTHIIEEMVQDIRNGVYAYQPAYGRLFIALINAVDEQLAITMAQNEINMETLQQIEAMVNRIRSADDSRRVEEAMRGELALLDGHYSLDLVAVSQFEGEAFSIFDATDMEFFHYLSECQRAVDPLHQTRMQVQIELARALNQNLLQPEDDQQLLAAIYTYEFFRVVKGNDVDQIRRRVFSAGSMLARIPGWSRASELVFQSNEKTDGSGFPRGLKGDAIYDAAKILHLVDSFISTALEHRDQGYKKSLFIAVKSINQLADIEYPQHLINQFNQIIKSHYLSQSLW
jgi:hypothetical protein